MVRRLVIGLLVLLIAGLVVADLAARRFAESRLVAVVEARSPGASSTTASVHGFPFVLRLLLQGRVAQVEVTQHDVAAAGLPLDRVEVKVAGVALDRGRLFDHEVAVRDIDEGTVTAELTEATLSSLAKVPVQLAGGKATATIGGKSVDVGLQIEAGSLLLDTPAGAVRVPVPELPLLPCVSKVQIVGDRAVLSCQLHEVPTALLPKTAAGF
jgi:hypothetical protein